MSVQSEVDSLWMLCDKGDLTREQFFVAVGITLGRLERSEESKRLSEVIRQLPVGWHPSPDRLAPLKAAIEVTSAPPKCSVCGGRHLPTEPHSEED